MKSVKGHIFVSIALFYILFAVFLSYTAQAQNKVFTIEEAVTAAGGKLIPKNLDQLQWVKGTSNYSYIENGVLKIFDAKTAKLINEIKKTDIDVALIDTKFDTLQKFPRCTWINSNTIRFVFLNKIFTFNVQYKILDKLIDYNASEMENADFNNVYSNVAYTKGNNLFINEKQITFDDKSGFVNGQVVHRNEFGINKGTFWSPDNDKLAYYHLDEHLVAEYPIYQLHNRPADARTIRYPIAGTPSHHASLCIFNTKNNTTVTIKTGEPKEKYLTNIVWTPDAKNILIAEVNRAQNNMKLNMYDATSGEFVKTLFEENNEKWVEPEHEPLFLKSDSKKFLWWSERDGYNHLYLYDISGKLIKQITKGNFVITEVNGFDKNEENIFVTTTAISPIERHLMIVNLKTGKSKILSSISGTHTSIVNFDGSYVIDIFQNQTTPRQIRIISTNGKINHLIYTAPNPLTDYKLGETTIGTIKANDGTELFYRLIKPINFNPDAKYPVVVYLYNGPHLQLVNNTWLGGANYWMQYMAQKGYYVFTIDGRGSMNRGFNFESAIFRKLGTVEMEDQLKGIEFLKTLPNVDADRIGIHGWSFGGFMTTSLMTRQPGIYKVGVAGGPVIDWGLYEIMYTERYMDTPDENPDGYKNSNLLNYTKNLKGKLLMIHGGEDDVVLWQHSLLYIEKCIKDGIQIDYFVYPHHPHNVSGKDRIHLMEKISNYFFDNL
ncbi:MAG: DPP IV N-terminal domain-containing protein [Bacteroidetes bacterium]|nr:DPP IV N-terminal domain-containing protein [Bacteroidota bacterium]